MPKVPRDDFLNGEVASGVFHDAILEIMTQAIRLGEQGIEDPALSGRSASLLRRLTALLDRPVYTDPDITIFAPWGGGSPCGDEGPGRLPWPMHEPADEISTGEPVVVRSK